jgi:GxxExxY protein
MPGSTGGNLLSERILGCAQALGIGFLEKVYEDALVHELSESGLAVSQQDRMLVVDVLVKQIVLPELNVVEAIDEIRRTQRLNHLRATGLHLCLPPNFGKPRLEIKRMVLGL